MLNAQEGLIKILVVDDEVIIRQLMGEILDVLGYEAILCGSPLEAIQIFTERHAEIALVFIDMMMPEMSGKQLYKEFTKIDLNKKVIVLSGYADDQEIQSLLDEGIAGFVQKPVSIKTLSGIIEQNL